MGRMGRVFVAVAALLWAGLASAVPATPSDIKILESAIDGVEAKNADMYQQANDAKVLEGMYNLSKVESKTVETLKEMASLQEEEKMVRKQFGMEKKGCCESHKATQRRLPKTEVNANAQYAARVSLANKILELRTVTFMAKILADLNKQAVKLATELKS